jgi:ribosomal protein S18 acetylase RimI-like enzyme
MKAATHQDVPCLVELMAAFYAESGYALDHERAAIGFKSLLGDEKLGRVWLAESGAKAAGYIVITHVFSMEYGGLVGFVDDFFVRVTLRGTGLGTSMLDELRASSAGAGLRALFVEVGADNAVAQRVYRRAGFHDSNRLLLALPLAPPTHLVDS